MTGYTKIIIIGTFLTLFPNLCVGETQVYKLGPEEKLSIKVWDIRNGEAFQWAALNDEFTIGADGSIILPLIGRTQASGKTLEEFASDVGEGLKRKIGLSIKPEAAVQITKYRPFYVIGAVQKPGRYEYQPGLTVLQAIGTAEGSFRDSSSFAYSIEKDNIAAQGEMQNLSKERVSLLAKVSRLSAEISGSDRIIFSPPLMRIPNDQFVEKTKNDETMLFNGRRDSLNAQLSAIGEAKSVLLAQLTSLSAKEATLARQIDLTRKDLNQVSELLSKGMAVAPRKLSAEQSVATFESNQLDVQLARLKAQHDLSQAERDSIDLRTKFKTNALSEIADNRSKISVIERRMSTADDLSKNAQSIANASSQNDDLNSFIFTVVSQGKNNEKVVTAFDMIEPGDVLNVARRNYDRKSGPLNAGRLSEIGTIDDSK